MDKQLLDYRGVVMRLLQQGKYPVLKNFVILEIYYKNFETKTIGSLQSSNTITPEVLFDKINDPYKIVFFTKKGNNFYSHKEDVFNLNLNHLPLKCKKIKIYKNDAILNLFDLKSDTTFEEEIYLFITYLNYDIPKIKDLLNLDFIESTTFIPLALKIKVSEYDIKNMVGSFEMPNFFGPNSNDLQVRLFEGYLSNCYSKTYILSLRDHHALEEYFKNNNEIDFLNNYHSYNIHYALNQKSFVPLAFNPLENPIIN